MAITFTSDPILSLADTKALLGVSTDLEAALLVNAVSAKFLRFTNRLRINSGSASEWHKGGTSKFYAHAAPIDTGETVTVSVYSDGVAGDTYTLAGGTLQVINSHVDAYVELLGTVPPYVEGVDTVLLSYTGGWDTVPGDIVLGAIDQIRVERERRQGTLGAMSVSQNGQTVQLETSGLIKAVEDAWRPYRIEV